MSTKGSMVNDLVFKRNAIVKPFILLITLTFSIFLHAETRVYFGNLHAHSALSDGHKSISPIEAFEFAMKESNLDFMSLSEHNHMLSNDEMKTLQQAVKIINQKQSSFVALYGQEYSTIKKGFNHTNIHNYPFVINKSLNGKYKKVFGSHIPIFQAQHPEHIIIAGFNHPKKIKTDYGFKADYNNQWTRFVTDLDPLVQLIAIGSGPADSNKKSITVNDSNDLIYRHFDSINAWFTYLANGMHLAPKYDHDSHSKTYGKRISPRTAVWVKGKLTQDKLLKALASRHVYATGDHNLKILATVNNDNLPGDILEHKSATLSVRVSDADEPNAKYTLSIYAGIVGSGVHPELIDTINIDHGKVTTSLSNNSTNEDMYFVIRIRQKATDPENGSLHNDAWLAPIWLNNSDQQDDHFAESPAHQFISSKNSKIYHLPQCRITNRIASHNLIYHTKQPVNKSLHKGCPHEE